MSNINLVTVFKYWKYLFIKKTLLKMFVVLFGETTKGQMFPN